MRDNLFHVLWLCGPAGVGKSTVSWHLFTELADAGVPVAFADTDQLGMCYPAAGDEPGRQQVKLRNVSAMITNYRAAGARYAIINGVIDPVNGLPADLLPQSAVTICRLRAGRDEVERRFIARHGHPDDVARLPSEVRDEIASLDQSSFADACVDTDGVRQGDVAALVRDACRAWPGFSAHNAVAGTEESELGGTGIGGAAAGGGGIDGTAAGGTAAGGEIVLITGPTGVGKSTIGFQVFVNCINARHGAGYVDLEQIGFVRPTLGGALPRHRLRARNLAAIWRNYRAAGATHLVATGPIEDRAAFDVYTEELPAASVRLCRLRAGYDQLSHRITSRGAGGSWPQTGDPLLGQPAQMLRAVAARAAEEAAALDRSGLGGAAVDTDGLTVDEAAHKVAQAVGWAGQRER
jgi:energy-coupling factor transporter ATP-binding protein EcfA2